MIICIRDGKKAPRFLEWSSVVDAPVTAGLTRKAMLAHLLQEYGRAREEEHRRRLDRAEKNGTSSLSDPSLTPETATHINRAGPHDAKGDGPIVCVAIDPFHAEGVEVVVTPNLQHSKERHTFIIGATDAPETVREHLRTARKTLEGTKEERPCKR